MTAKRFVDRRFWFGVIPKLECIRSYRFPVMNKKPQWDVRVCPCGKSEKKKFHFYKCIQCLPWHCQSILILWHFDYSLDFFNFSLRGTKIHPKKPAFLRPIKSFIFLKYMPRLHLLPSRISTPPTNRGDTPLSDSPACGMSSLHLLPKILHLLKNFWEPWVRHDIQVAEILLKLALNTNPSCI